MKSQEQLDREVRLANSVLEDRIPELRDLRRQRDEIHAANNRLLEERRTAALVPFLIAKAQWSARTFGAGMRTRGICEHIRKELIEIEADPTDLMEWVDVFMLATDGFWRAWVQVFPEGSLEAMALDFVRLIREKHAINEARTWPAPKSEDEAVEHVRGEVNGNG